MGSPIALSHLRGRSWNSDFHPSRLPRRSHAGIAHRVRYICRLLCRAVDQQTIVLVLFPDAQS